MSLETLIAVRSTAGIWSLVKSLQDDAGWSVSGIVDPRAEGTLEYVPPSTAVLISAADVLWLLRHRSRRLAAKLLEDRLLVLVEQDNVIETVTHGARLWGYLLDQTFNTLAIERLQLSVEGYLVGSARLMRQLLLNDLRLEAAARLVPDELHVLHLLGIALTNREIAEESGLTDARVKILVNHLRKKLWLRNRTAVAVFSYQHGFTQSDAGGYLAWSR